MAKSRLKAAAVLGVAFLGCVVAPVVAQVPVTDQQVTSNTKQTLDKVTQSLTQLQQIRGLVQKLQQATGSGGSSTGIGGMLSGAGLGSLMGGGSNPMSILNSLTGLATQITSMVQQANQSNAGSSSAAASPTCTPAPAQVVTTVTCMVNQGAVDVFQAGDGSGTVVIDQISAVGSPTDGSTPYTSGLSFTTEASTCPANATIVSAGQVSVPSTAAPVCTTVSTQSAGVQQGLQALNSVLGGGATGQQAMSQLSQALYASPSASGQSVQDVNTLRAMNVASSAVSALSAAMNVKNSVGSSGASDLQSLIGSITGSSNIRSDLAGNTSSILKMVEQQTATNGLLASGLQLQAATAIANSAVRSP